MRDVGYVREILRKQTEEAGSINQWAFENDFSPAFVSYVLNGQKEPSPRLLECLGFVRVNAYVEASEMWSKS